MSLDSLDVRRLRRRIRIERKVSTPDLIGGESVSYTLVAVVAAEVRQKSGRESLVSQEIQPVVSQEFLMRYRTDVLFTDRIVWKGQNYDIVDIAEVGRNVGLRIIAKRPGGEATG